MSAFEVTVMVDGSAYHTGQSVRFTVTATNNSPQPVEHTYPGWRRFDLSVRDELHRIVADTEIDLDSGEGFTDRWLPGQMMILPVYWAQNEGPLVPGWSRRTPGPRPLTGRYRGRVTWLGREPGDRADLPDCWTPWFTLV